MKNLLSKILGTLIVAFFITCFALPAFRAATALAEYLVKNLPLA